MTPHCDLAKRDAMAHAARRAGREDRTFWVWWVNCHDTTMGGRKVWTNWFVLPEGQDPERMRNHDGHPTREWAARPAAVEERNWGPRGLLPWEGDVPRRVWSGYDRKERR